MKKGLLKKLSALCAAILLIMSLAVFSAMAADEVPDGGEGDPIVTEPAPDPEPDPVTEAPPDPIETAAPEVETYDMTPSYEAPEHLDDLPQAESYEVELATEIPQVQLPDVEVSDTTLIGGVIAWLSIALGISVIVGVLVSRRTKGKNQR